MAVEKRIKNKMKKAELFRDKLNALQKKKEELEDAIKTIEKLESEFKEEIYKVEDYFIEHNASLRIETIEIIKGIEIDILIAHHGTSTFAAFGGIVTSAKLDPEDKFVPQIGEAIATQRLVNKILEANYGAKF
jgi:hypothetical protein